MPIPAGATDRTAGVVGHFFPEIDPRFARHYMRARSTVPEAISALFYTIPVPEQRAYVVLQGWFERGRPRRINRGQPVTDAGFTGFTQTIYAHQYGTDRYPIHRSDDRDSNAPVKPRDVAKESAKWLGQLELWVLPELLAGAVSTELHEDTDLTNELGGSGLYSNSHSVDGQTLDNIVSGTGTTFQAWKDDYYSAVLLFDTMPAPNGRAYWGDDVSEDRAMTLLAPKERRETLHEILKSTLVLQGGATAPSSNFLRDVMNGKITPHISTALSDTDDWYLFLTQEDLRPFVKAEKEGIRMEEWRNKTSDWAKTTQQEGERHLVEVGFTIGAIPCAVAIQN